MTSRPLLSLIVLLGACGGVQYATLTATPAAATADVSECVRSNLGKLRYSIQSYDATDYRIVARKFNESTHRADPQFRRMIDRLEVDMAPTAAGKTDLKVVAHTLAEYSTQRGPTETEEKASSDVNEAAQAVIQACGTP